jgi:hypothetical protein
MNEKTMIELLDNLIFNDGRKVKKVNEILGLKIEIDDRLADGACVVYYKDEFCLSDKIYIDGAGNHKLFPQDVKEFIKKLEMEFYDFKNFEENRIGQKAKEIIDKLAGDKLI